MTLGQVMGWAQDHPEMVIAIAAGALANLAPRPDHAQMTGWRRVFWKSIDMMCFLEAQARPKYKWFFVPSPSPATAVPVAPGDVSIQDKQEEKINESVP